jgi:transcriptional regulator with XRE-family HTH domain
MAAAEAAGTIQNLRAYRESLRISQAELARIAGVSRYKLNQLEQGSGQLTAEEWGLVHAALKTELERLRQMPAPTVGGVAAA